MAESDELFLWWMQPCEITCAAYPAMPAIGDIARMWQTLRIVLMSEQNHSLNKGLWVRHKNNQ
jgi:hypothetical protein